MRLLFGAPAARFLAATCLLAVLPLSSGPAAAQTAKDLTCKGCVGKKDLGKKSVATTHLRKRAVTAVKIAKGAVRTPAINNRAVTPAKLSGSAKPGAVSSAEDYLNAVTVDTASDTAPAEILADTLKVPAKGNVLVHANFDMEMPADSDGTCWVTLNETGYTAERRTYAVNESDADLVFPASITTVFADVSAGKQVIRLLCKRYGATGFDVFDTSLTALFVPNAM